MKRERKIRFWDEIKHQMFYDFEIETDIGKFKLLECPNCIAMEYTGFVDKKGNNVYESDIVKLDENIICEVVWLSEKGQWRLNTKNKIYMSNCWDLCRPFTIIGNIYQNSELLG